MTEQKKTTKVLTFDPATGLIDKVVPEHPGIEAAKKLVEEAPYSDRTKALTQLMFHLNGMREINQMSPLAYNLLAENLAAVMTVCEADRDEVDAMYGIIQTAHELSQQQGGLQ